ncbi:MAG: hypothetical protein QM726_11270 [Chitinophagaceae bacterium]
MGKFKKVFKKTFLVFFILIPIASFAHYILFPQQTRCILIDYSSFKKSGRLYYNTVTEPSKLDTLNTLIAGASKRVAAYWGNKISNPKFIYCDKEEDFKYFGSAYGVPALTHMKGCTYIVLSKQAVDLDIIAHELSHAEFYNRIGFYNWTFKIPRWFDEGLAMQNDYRNYYSEDTLRVKTDNYKTMPDVKSYTSSKQFDEGGIEKVMLNFMAAKHEVKKWYTKERLENLIRDINAGKSFSEAFFKPVTENQPLL